MPEQTDDPTTSVHLGTADDKLQNLSKDAKQKAWEHDSLSLARDVAAIAKMHQQVLKNDKAERLRRIAHVRSENMIGGSIVSNHMEQHAKHMAGTESDLTNGVEQALGTCFFRFFLSLHLPKKALLSLHLSSTLLDLVVFLDANLQADKTFSPTNSISRLCQPCSSFLPGKLDLVLWWFGPTLPSLAASPQLT